MKKFKVVWTEKHSAYVWAKDDDDAVNEALMADMAESCDNQSVDDVFFIEEETGPDPMDVSHAAAEEEDL